MSRLGLLTFSLAVAFAAAQQDKIIDCYGYSGITYPNNTKCPGSNACCGAGATCLSNRLCHKPNDGPGTFLRAPCAIYPYDSGTCAQICLYSKVSWLASWNGKSAGKSTTSANLVEDETTGALPRVRVCADGSLCCDDDAFCCDNGDGTFLDERGQLTDSPPSTTYLYGPERTAATFRMSDGVSTISELLSTTEAAPSSSSTAPSSTPDSGSADTSNNGVKIGVGVAVPVVCLILIGVGFWIWRRKRGAKGQSDHSSHQAEMNQGGYKTQPESSYPQYPQHGGRPVTKYELPGRSEPVELDGGYTK